MPTGDPSAAPVKRRLSWEGELDVREGFVERATGLVPDIWARGGGWRLVAVVVAPFWAVGILVGAGLGIAAFVVVAGLAAGAIGAAFYLVYALLARITGLLG